MAHDFVELRNRLHTIEDTFRGLGLALFRRDTAKAYRVAMQLSLMADAFDLYAGAKLDQSV